MEIKTIRKVHFSPSGTTKKVLDGISGEFNCPSTEIDLLRHPLTGEVTLNENELLIIALPVYYGRLPAICSQMLSNLKGINSLAVAVVVYGNREYDDALIELRDILTENGFRVIGAAAFIAQHSIFPIVAKDRPDEKDIAIAADFADKCYDIISSSQAFPNKLIDVNGNREYCAIGNVPFSPSVSDDCNDCEECSAICPVGAIFPKIPRETNSEICIACAACIAFCPQNARAFLGEAYEISHKGFAAKFSEYKYPELFYL